MRALRLQGDAEIAVGGREVGLGGDDLPVAGLGVRQAAGLVMMDGRNEESRRVVGCAGRGVRLRQWWPAVGGS